MATRQQLLLKKKREKKQKIEKKNGQRARRLGGEVKTSART